MVAEVRLERTSLAYETKLEPPPVYSAMKLRQKWFRQMESNHLPIGYRPIARPESFAGMEPGVRVELTYPVYKTGASPRMRSEEHTSELQSLPTRRSSDLSPYRLSADCSPGELCRNGAGCQSRTDLSGLQNRRIATHAYPADTLGAGAGNRTLDRPPTMRLLCH